MKYQKLFLTVAAFSLAFICASCSQFTQFVIVNKSPEAVEIQLRYKPLEGKHYLKKTNLDEKENIIHENWQDLTPEEFEENRPEETVKLKLASNEAVGVALIPIYGGHELKIDEFDIKELNIEGSLGTIHLENRQVLTQFQRVSDGLYTIVYQ